MKRPIVLAPRPLAAPERVAAPPPPARKILRPTRWLLLGGLISSFTGALLILGLTLKRYYEIERFATATRAEDLAPGVNAALMVGGPILVLGIATTVAGLVMWFVRRMLG